MPRRHGNPLPQQQLRDILARWLRSGLAARGWSQVDLAEHVEGVGREAINKIAQGRTTPDDETIDRLARAMGVDPPKLAADPFDLGVGDREWLNMMAERYRRAAAAVESAEQLKAAPLEGSGQATKRRRKDSDR